MSNVATISSVTQPRPGTIDWLNACVERSRREVFAEVVLLTPELAGELLRRNPDNRGIRKTKATQYAGDIRAGRWVFNGEPIIISTAGTLNDGQHRAQAVVDTNLSIPALLTFGLPLESRLTIDQGAARTAGDYLSMEGVENSTVQASIARTVIAYEQADRKGLTGSQYITNGDVMTRVHSDAKIAEASHFAVGVKARARAFAPPAVIGFCYYVFSAISHADADQYMRQVCRGEGLKAKDPAYTVRERLVSLGRQSREDRIHIIFRGWNAFRQRRSLSIAKIMPNENIPAAI